MEKKGVFLVHFHKWLPYFEKRAHQSTWVEKEKGMDQETPFATEGA